VTGGFCLAWAAGGGSELWVQRRVREELLMLEDGVDGLEEEIKTYCFSAP
jgi:hypothetical protein